MKHALLNLFGICLVALLMGCGGARPTRVLVAEDQYLLAQKKFDEGRYQDAQLEFQKLIWNYPGSDYVDDGQYYLAECYRLQEDYPGAVVENERLLRSYSQSPFAPAAQYHLALCYYQQSLPSNLDQEFTHKAIQEVQVFLEDYPNSEFLPQARELLLQAQTKLAKKSFDTAYLYYKLGNFDSAIIYIEELLREFTDTRWAVDAQYLMGECYRDQENWSQALSAYRQVLEMDASEKTAQRARKRIQQVEEKLSQAEKASG